MSGLFTKSIWEAAGPPRCRGGARKFDTPHDMIAKAIEYFKYCEENSLEEEVLFANGAQTKRHKIPFLKSGLMLFLGLEQKSYTHYRDGTRDQVWTKDPRYIEGDLTFAEATAWIDDTMASQKLAGAMAGIYDGRLVGRVLGLAERTELSGPDGGPIEHRVELTEDVAAALDSIAARLASSTTSGIVAGQGEA